MEMEVVYKSFFNSSQKPNDQSLPLETLRDNLLKCSFLAFWLSLQPPSFSLAGTSQLSLPKDLLAVGLGLSLSLSLSPLRLVLLAFPLVLGQKKCDEGGTRREEKMLLHEGVERKTKSC